MQAAWLWRPAHSLHQGLAINTVFSYSTHVVYCMYKQFLAGLRCTAVKICWQGRFSQGSSCNNKQLLANVQIGLFQRILNPAAGSARRVLPVPALSPAGAASATGRHRVAQHAWACLLTSAWCWCGVAAYPRSCGLVPLLACKRCFPGWRFFARMAGFVNSSSDWHC